MNNCISLLLAFFLFNSLALARTKGDCYQKEADSFLQSMPNGLQSKQCAAIWKAIVGDTVSLMQVRQSRNTPTALPENITAEYVKPHLRLYKPLQSKKELPLLIYLHGGGWTFGSINSCARFCSTIAASGEAMVLAVDYALAPERPFPQGLNDCLDAVCFAQQHAGDWGGNPASISIGGDSSGGNLAIATALKLIERNDSCPLRSLVLFYPVVKAYADSLPSWETYGKGYALDSELMEAFNHAYAGNEPENPYISVAHADDELLRQLPPVLIVAAGRDILHDQGEEFAQHLRMLGATVLRQELQGAVHLFITVPGQEAAFQQATKLALDFLSAPGGQSKQ